MKVPNFLFSKKNQALNLKLEALLTEIKAFRDQLTVWVEEQQSICSADKKNVPQTGARGCRTNSSAKGYSVPLGHPKKTEEREFKGR